MDIKQLKTLETLALTKNYIKTSEILNYAPSTLAKHIHSLENEFNITLVRYSNGAIELTEEGSKFLQYAKKILSVYTQCESEFKNIYKQQLIRVAGGELMVAYSFGDFFLHRQQHQDDIDLQVNSICCALVPGWLKNNECDIGYVQMVDMGDNGNCKVTPLFQEKLCVMAREDHPLAKMDKVCTADFNGFKFTYTYSECCFTDKFRSDLTQASIQLESELFLGSITAVINSCLSENRLCLIPYVCVEKIKKFGLVPINWVDSFNIYDCILTQDSINKNDILFPLIENSKEYVKSLSKQSSTNKIVML